MRWKLDECSTDLQKQIRRKIETANNHTAIRTTNMESRACNEPLATEKASRFDGQVSLCVHSQRHKLTDSDGACFKYALDAIVSAGILSDDSPQIIPESPRETQSKISKMEPEKTTIIIKSLESTIDKTV